MKLENTVLDNAPDFGDENLEQIGDLIERAPRWPSGMCYGYKEGCLVLIAHVSIRRGQDEVREFCGTFYRSPIVPDLRVDKEASILHLEREAKLPASNIGENYIEQPGLVNIVELRSEEH